MSRIIKLLLFLAVVATSFCAVNAGPASGDRALTNVLVPNAIKRLFERTSEPAFQCNNPRIVGVANDVTVEAQLVLFKNGLTGTGDNKYSGEDCELFPLDDCDYKIKMLIDDENVFGRWPTNTNANFVTTMKMNSRRETIKLQSDKKSTNDDDYIFKACRHIDSLTVLVVRLLVLDEDTGNDEVVNQFNCYWAPSKLASNEAESQWDEINCCTALECDTARDAIQEARIRVRAYFGNDCPDTGLKP